MTDYIKTLRKAVGHAPIMQCGASIIVINHQNEILLQKRLDNGCWGYAGGSIELDEVVEDAARRELFEETGLTAGKIELYGVFSGPDFHYVYPNGDEVSNIDHVYLCRDYSGELKCEKSEITELRFFPLDKIPENISPPVRKVIRKYVSENTRISPVDKNHPAYDKSITYRRADLPDIKTVAELTLLLYTDNTYDELLAETGDILSQKGHCFFLAFDGEKAVGTAQCSLRYDYVEGTQGGNIGYLEGIYVLPEYRRKGIAAKLVKICEEWAVQNGCAEFASDCELNNKDSYDFHISVGFKEANRIICFIKLIYPKTGRISQPER